MFALDGLTILLSRGDTGTLTIRETGATFASDDRAVFTVRDPQGGVVIEKVLEIDDGAVEVGFENADTDSLAAGSYTWDIRYVVTPVYDTPSGRITGGAEVLTPKLPQKFIVLPTVGQI